MDIRRQNTDFTITFPKYQSFISRERVRILTPFGDFEVERESDVDSEDLELSFTIMLSFKNFQSASVTQTRPDFKELGSFAPDDDKWFSATIRQPVKMDLNVKVSFIGLTFNQKLLNVKNFDNENKSIDITFQCENGKTLQAHHTLLATFTPYFDALHNFNKTNVVNIKEDEFDLYKAVLDFCYRGQIDESLTYDGFLQLYKHAHYLCLEEMLMPLAWFVVDRYDGTEKEAIDVVLQWEPYNHLQWHMCRKFKWWIDPRDPIVNHPFVGNPGILLQLFLRGEEFFDHYWNS